MLAACGGFQNQSKLHRLHLVLTDASNLTTETILLLPENRASPPWFHFSQLAQLPFEWPVARLSFDFPSVASFAQNVSRSGSLKLGLRPSCLRARPEGRQSLPLYFRALALLKHCIDSLDGFILNLWSFGRRPCKLNWLKSVMTLLR